MTKVPIVAAPLTVVLTLFVIVKELIVKEESNATAPPVPPFTVKELSPVCPTAEARCILAPVADPEVVSQTTVALIVTGLAKLIASPVVRILPEVVTELRIPPVCVKGPSKVRLTVESLNKADSLLERVNGPLLSV